MRGSKHVADRGRVLLIWADADMRSLVAAALQRAGHSVVDAGSLEAAATEAARRRPDALVMDTALSRPTADERPDGALASLTGIPCVLCAPDAAAGREVVRALVGDTPAPVSVVLTRPLSPGQLAQRVAEVMAAQATLQEDREAFARPAPLADVLALAVIATDLDFAIRYWNPAAEDLYGWLASEALGRDALALIPSTLTPDRLDEIRSTIRSGKPFRGVLLTQRRDGTTVPVMVVKSPLRNAAGEVVGMVGVSFSLEEVQDAGEANGHSEHGRANGADRSAASRYRLQGAREAAVVMEEAIGDTLATAVRYAELLVAEAALGPPAQEWARQVQRTTASALATLRRFGKVERWSDLWEVRDLRVEGAVRPANGATHQAAPRRPEARRPEERAERAVRLARMAAAGQSLREIAAQEGVSYERVRQILASAGYRRTRELVGPEQMLPDARGAA